MNKHALCHILTFASLCLLAGCGSGSGLITSTKIQSALTATNQAPTSTLSLDRAMLNPLGYPTNITFTIGYNDPEGANGTYSLDYGDESSKETGTIKSGDTIKLEHIYIPHCGPICTYNVTLMITDDNNATTSSSANILFMAGVKAL